MVIIATAGPTLVNVTLELAVHKPFVTVQTAVAVVPAATLDTVIEELLVEEGVPPVTVQTPVPGDGLLATKLNEEVLQSV